MANEKKNPDIDLDPEMENAETSASRDAAADFDAQDGRQDDDTYELDTLKAENADLKDRLLRALAETDNLRKRAEKERSDTAKYAVGNFARQLITVADNLRRALDSISEDHRAEHEAMNSIFIGVEATERELLRAFDSAGIKPIETEGQLFNPNFHEVMFEADMPDKPTGTIIQVIEPGYMIHDRLLRPARVGVAKGGPQAEKSNIDKEI